MREWSDFTTTTGPDGEQDVALSGPLVVASVARIDPGLRAIEGRIARIDLSQVSAIDTVGAWLAFRLANRHGATITGASVEARRLIAAVGACPEETDITPPRAPLVRRVLDSIGDYVTASGAGSIAFLGFIGQMILAVCSMIRHPSRFRGKALVHQMELVGVSALGIIGLMSFLVGVVIAQQGAVQLKQFGAEIYTINLTGRLSFRELGVLMTAIMVAGRSGSAFAAQLGTMKLTEEVDAMRTIGVSPIEALVIPRVLACTFMMILLGFYASLAAIVGGATISTLTLDIPFMTFLSRIQEVVPLHDLWVGLIKAPVFGAIVALSGCYQGMQVEGNSEEVGTRTTTAVVQAIFAVIVLDAFFAVFFSEVGWG
ncbi:MAG: ABC transporter permease [Proteobacteria bacterium]|nr:ABC transporter permease [Pseudomonadota bacterium]MDE2412089.1 ABC transporter permease [Sphingomonadales bacterium]